jgi:hypothetical protein
MTPNTKSFIEKSFRRLDLKSRTITYNDDELTNITSMLASEDLNSQILALDIMSGMHPNYIEQLIGRQTNSGLRLTPASSIKWDWGELTEIMLVCYPSIGVNHIKGTHLYDGISMSGYPDPWTTGYNGPIICASGSWQHNQPVGWSTFSPFSHGQPNKNGDIFSYDESNRPSYLSITRSQNE